MRRAKRLVAVALTSASVLAINDGRVSAEECSDSTTAVGTPQGDLNPGLAVSEPVGPPASAFSTGPPPAKARTRSALEITVWS